MTAADRGRRDAAWLRVAVCLVFLLFFRAAWAFRPTLANDDGCYLKILDDLVDIGLPAACRLGEAAYAPGAAWSWVPVSLLAKLVAGLTGGAALEWVIPSVALFSFGSWAATLVLLSCWLRQTDFDRLAGVPSAHVPGWALILLGGTPILYYATHRTLLSHPTELLCSVAALVAFSSGRFFLGAAAAVLACATRYNDAPILLLVVGRAVDEGRVGRDWKDPRRWLLGGGALAILGWSLWLAFLHGHQGLTLPALLKEARSQPAVEFLVGSHFGLLWTGPIWVFALALGARYLRRLSWFARAAWVWVLSEGILAASWGGAGSDFGYRYLLGSFVGAWVIWLELLAQGLASPPLFRRLSGGAAILVTWLLLFFKTVPGTGAVVGATLAPTPGLIWILLALPFRDPGVFKTMVVQQFPAVTFWISLMGSGGEEGAWKRYQIQGPGLFLLTAALAVTLSVLVVSCIRIAKPKARPFSDGFAC